MNAPLLLHRADGALPSTVFRPAAFGMADPFASQREIAWEGPAAMCAGRVAFEGGTEIAYFPHAETLVVVAGELSLQTAGLPALMLRRGEGALITRGTALRVMAVSRTVFVSCASATDDAGQPGIRPLRADADFKPSSPPPVEVLLGPSPQCRSDNVYTDERMQVRVGLWDSTPYHRISRHHRVNEFMFLLTGSVRFASPDGSVLAAHAGDAVFIPQGTPTGWESSERVAKIYAVQDVPA